MKTNELRPVEKQSAEAQVVQNLRDYILSGAVTPGGRLTEIPLAETLCVARATLRTGLHRLASEGIIEQIPYSGWRVIRLSLKDVWELWTIRGSLEGLAAKLAMENSDIELHAAIEVASRALLEVCDREDMSQVNMRDFNLHRSIIKASAHSRLEHQYLLIEQQIRLYILTSNKQVAEGPSDIAEQHRPLIEALRAKDPQRAASEAWLHNESEGLRLMSRLQHQVAAA